MKARIISLSLYAAEFLHNNGLMPRRKSGKMLKHIGTSLQKEIPKGS